MGRAISTRTAPSNLWRVKIERCNIGDRANHEINRARPLAIHARSRRYYRVCYYYHLEFIHGGGEIFAKKIVPMSSFHSPDFSSKGFFAREKRASLFVPSGDGKSSSTRFGLASDLNESIRVILFEIGRFSKQRTIIIIIIIVTELKCHGDEKRENRS